MKLLIMSFSLHTPIIPSLLSIILSSWSKALPICAVRNRERERINTQPSVGILFEINTDAAHVLNSPFPVVKSDCNYRILSVRLSVLKHLNPLFICKLALINVLQQHSCLRSRG